MEFEDEHIEPQKINRQQENYILLFEDIVKSYNQAVSYWDGDDSLPMPPSASDFADVLDALVIAVRIDERKRTNRDVEITQLNKMTLSDEEFETAHMTFEEKEQWRRENPDRRDKK